MIELRYLDYLVKGDPSKAVNSLPSEANQMQGIADCWET